MSGTYSDLQLVELALAARQRAYAPYSGFRVGSALLVSGNYVFTGCNVENASYGLAVCAERVAVFSAVAAGHRQFLTLAVAAGGVDYCQPCGACLQVLSEFGPQLRLLLANDRGEFQVRTVADLLPGAFSLPRKEG